MTAALSAENRIGATMQALGITAEFLAGLATAYGYRGIDQPKISKALRGVKPLPHDQAEFLLDLLHKLKIRIFDPLELVGVMPRFKEPTRVRKLLEDAEAGFAQIIVVTPVEEAQR